MVASRHVGFFCARTHANISAFSATARGLRQTWTQCRASVARAGRSTLHHLFALSILALSSTAHAVPKDIGFWSNFAPYVPIGQIFSSPGALCGQVLSGFYSHNPPVWAFSITEATASEDAEGHSTGGGCSIHGVYLPLGGQGDWGPYPIHPLLTCPSNSTLVGGLCVCNSPRWTEREEQCVPVKDTIRTGEPKQCIGNPIYPLNGTKREEIDLGIQTGRARMKLVYDSSPAAPISASAERPDVVKPLVAGELWSSSMHRKVLLHADGKGALVARGDGHTESFTGNGAGAYTADSNTQDRLVSVPGGYRYTDAAARSQESYDSAGKLLAIHWANGENLSLSYSTAATSATVAPAPDYLIQAQDGYGRATNFVYILTGASDPATGGLLSRILDAQGQTTVLAYDPVPKNLISITWPDGQARYFHYDLPQLPKALAGITDELLVRYANFGYDAQGRAVSTEHIGGVDRFSVTYTTPPDVVVSETYDSVAKIVSRDYAWGLALGTSVTTPAGASRGMGAVSINGQSYLTSQSQPAGSGCAASTSAMAYDANGNLASRDDFNGTRACYVSDLNRNLPTTKVEGLANTASCAAVTPNSASLPANSRKTSTEWHPDWSLATRVAEPGKRSTYVYNGQPDPLNGGAIASCAPASALLPDGKPIAVLCKQVEQATTDTNGSLGFDAALQSTVPARIRQWTYNATGQVLTDTDALNRTTVFAYYTDATADHKQGDLQSVTNAVGKVTNYTRYNGNGQLLEMVDANGGTTVNTYDARGRQLTSSVGGQATSYAYDFSGQPTRTTQADGSWIEYEYDPARRMKAVVDSQGNRIDYTLDNEGKVTAQTVKDPAGNIARTLSRSIDALGRVQQITGKQ